MSPAELLDARDVLNLSSTDLAADFNCTPAVVEAWAKGTVRVPRRVAQDLRWQVALVNQERAFHSAGLAPCPTSASLFVALEAPKADAIVILKKVETHAASCAQCQAREAFARTLPPLPPPPLRAGARVVGALSAVADRLPAWARPALWGALLIGTIVLLRVVVMLVVAGPSWRLLSVAGLGLAVGGYLGAVGGGTYYLVRPRVRRMGRAAPYVTGIACAVAYLLAFMIPAAIVGEEIARDPGGWGIMALVAVVFGLVVGHSLLRTLDA